MEHASAALVPVAVPVSFAAIVFLIAWVTLAGWRLQRLAGPRSTARGG